jgi:hypothetical protein
MSVIYLIMCFFELWFASTSMSATSAPSGPERDLLALQMATVLFGNKEVSESKLWVQDMNILCAEITMCKQAALDDCAICVTPYLKSSSHLDNVLSRCSDPGVCRSAGIRRALSKVAVAHQQTGEQSGPSVLSAG